MPPVTTAVLEEMAMGDKAVGRTSCTMGRRCWAGSLLLGSGTGRSRWSGLWGSNRSTPEEQVSVVREIKKLRRKEVVRWFYWSSLDEWSNMLLCVTEKRRETSHRLNFLPILPVQDTLCQLSHLRGQEKMRMKAGVHLDLGGGGQDGVDRGGDGQETGCHL